MIKRKEFEINCHGQVIEKRYVKPLGRTYLFIACESGGNFHGTFGRFKSGHLNMSIGNVICSSIEEARDWLFGEYNRMAETGSEICTH